MSRGTVISLCDHTGIFVRPWVEAGYRSILVDPQHGTSSYGHVTRLAMTVEQSLPWLADIIAHENVRFVAAFPPCTDLSGSGARWWADKRAADYMFQAKAVAVAEQCRTVARLSRAPYLIENPAGALSRVFGKATHTFHPYEFTKYEPADNYTKKTCLWTGGGFIMPNPSRDESLGAPDDRIHKAPPGDERANFRSATPLGFARAVFRANSGYAQGAVA